MIVAKFLFLFGIAEVGTNLRSMRMVVESAGHGGNPMLKRESADLVSRMDNSR